MQEENGRTIIFQGERLLTFLKSLWDITGTGHKVEKFLLYSRGAGAEQKYFEDIELSRTLLDFVTIVLFY